MTVQIYLKNTYLFHSRGLILRKGEDEQGVFVILDQTVFYPQGGGQPSDQGVIQNSYFEADVILVRHTHDEIRHYISLPAEEIPINFKVDCFVDEERRLLNSRYHTASHLLGNVVEILYSTLKALKGHSVPGEAYVEFQGNVAVDAGQIQSAVNKMVAKNDKTKTFDCDPASFEQEFYKLPYSIPENKTFRVVQIGSLLPIPCGGTHLSFIREIGHIAIGKIKIRNNIVRISYTVI